SPLVDNNQVAINFNDNKDLNPYIQFEHPVPFLPNFKLQQNHIESSGFIPVSDPTFLDGQEVMVRGDMNFSHVDLMLYYELLDNWINLDLGISAKYFDGYQRFKYQTEIDDELDFDHLIPMLYIKGQFDLPLTGLSAAATVEALSFDSNKVTDIELALKYQFKFGLGMDVGYRTLDIDLKNINSFKSDMKMQGLFIGGYFEF
ncbi:MAG: TIGR04219 family outer membrane beta-barrel protein, partial [Marinicella sp.]